jgi:DNA-binding SARP family transcriptional activator
MSLADNTDGQQSEQLAVLFCDLSHTQPAAEGPGSDLALWRVNYFRTAREMATDHGGREATTAAGGWIATFDSTIEALVCARDLSTLVGWRTTGPSLSGGLSAGEVFHLAFGIAGSPVDEAIALCRQARPRQVLVADPLKVVLAGGTNHSFASARPDGRPVAAETEEAPARWGAWSVGGVSATSRHGTERPSPLRILRATTEDHHGPPQIVPTNPPAQTVETAEPDPSTPPTAAESNATGLRLSVLGWVQLEGAPATTAPAVLRGCQTRAVLCMLALRRGPVHKDELAELLWPRGLPDHWEGALRGLITKIRRFLDTGGLSGRETLVGEDGYYELRLPLAATVDRHHATVLIARAESALGAKQAARAATLVAAAVTILERRLLGGQDNTWFDQIRAELSHDRLAALELLARADLEAGNVEGARQAAAKALALDPYRESSYRLLMQAHAAGGSRGEALRTYERCRRMLADELGVGPATQTQTLYVQLLG